jgi:hypothetical protein
MKMSFDFGRFVRELPKANLVCLVLLIAVTAGCGKSGDSVSVAPAPPPAPSSDAATAQAPVPVPQPMQTVVVTNTDDQTKQMQALNRALVGWMIRNRRHPQTFQEFASTAGFQIPNPPPGKKYTLNTRGFIVLVDASN